MRFQKNLLLLFAISILSISAFSEDNSLKWEETEDGRVILTDRTGNKWDITHGVNNHGVSRNGFKYGLGPDSFKAEIINDYSTSSSPNKRVFVASIKIEDGDDDDENDVFIRRAYDKLAIRSAETVLDNFPGVGPDGGDLNVVFGYCHLAELVGAWDGTLKWEGKKYRLLLKANGYTYRERGLDKDTFVWMDRDHTNTIYIPKKRAEPEQRVSFIPIGRWLGRGNKTPKVNIPIDEVPEVKVIDMGIPEGKAAWTTWGAAKDKHPELEFTVGSVCVPDDNCTEKKKED